MSLKKNGIAHLLPLFSLSFLALFPSLVLSEEDPQAVLQEARSHLPPTPGVWVVLSQRTQDAYPAMTTAAKWFPSIILDDDSQAQATVKLGDELQLVKVYYYGTEEEIQAVQPGMMSFLRLGEGQFVPHPLAGEYPQDLLAQVLSGVSAQADSASIDWKQLVSALNSRPQPPASSEPAPIPATGSGTGSVEVISEPAPSPQAVPGENISQAQAQLEEEQAKNRQLSEEVTKLRADAAQPAPVPAAPAADPEQARRLAQISAENESLNGKIQDLQEQLASAQAGAPETAKTLQSKQAELSRLTDKLKETEQESAGKTAELEKKIERLEQDLAARQKDAPQAARTLQSKQEELDRLTEKLREAEQESAAKSRELEVKIQRLEATLASKQ